MAKALPQTYEPTNPPIEFEGWHRWIDDELHRIQFALASNPVIMAVNDSDTIPIDDPVEITQIFIGATVVIDDPSGSFDPVTGEYTASLAGLYNVNASMVIQPFGLGNKSYSCGLEVRVNGVERAISFTGGADDVPLGVSLAQPLVLLNADVLTFFAHALHEIFTGTVDIDTTLSIIRQAST